MMLRSCLGFSVILVLAGCGDNGTSGGGGNTGTSATGTGGSADATTGASPSTTTATASTGSGEISFDQACKDQATAVCALSDKCTNGFLTKTQFKDLDDCVTVRTQNCLSSHSATGSTITAETTEACANAYPTFDCNKVLDGFIPAACGPTPGSLANAAACAYNAQCKSTYCKVASTSACGVCADLPKAGDSCAEESGCGTNTNLRCTATTKVCATLVAKGGDCSDDKPCERGLSCVGATDTDDGVCAEAVETVGGLCDNAAAGNPDCDRIRGLRCNTKTNECEAVLLVDSGACGNAAGVFTDCTDQGLCTKPGGAGTCVAAATDGSACDTAAGPDCPSLSRCVTGGTGTAGTCTALDSTACK